MQDDEVRVIIGEGRVDGGERKRSDVRRGEMVCDEEEKGKKLERLQERTKVTVYGISETESEIELAARKFFAAL